MKQSYQMQYRERAKEWMNFWGYSNTESAMITVLMICVDTDIVLTRRQCGYDCGRIIAKRFGKILHNVSDVLTGLELMMKERMVNDDEEKVS